MPSVHEIANYFILRGIEDCDTGGEYITHLKLQKLLYFSQAWYLGIFGESLFEEPIQAWIHGPVCPDVYHELKSYDWHPIEKQYGESVRGAPQVLDLLEEVWMEYGIFSAKELERMTHEDPPWIEAREGLPAGANSSQPIYPENIQKVYSDRAIRNGEEY